MKTIALRFSDNYAPKEGMIYHHNKIISDYGFVWYGKFGNNISSKIANELLELPTKKFLLIKSGGQERYWAYFDCIQKDIPPLEFIPSYYRKDTDRIKCWFKITKIERAEPNIMSKCNISSTGQILSLASKYSMSPYFIININSDVKGEEND